MLLLVEIEFGHHVALFIGWIELDCFDLSSAPIFWSWLG